jgi:hypothetical protein
MKKRIDDTLEQNKLEIDEIYKTSLGKWNAECANLERKRQEVAEEESAERQKMLKEVQHLKIVIPKRLQDIYDSVTRV